ncbi:hypothetical protein ANMWB30_09510 [Arthrobacter sp. MWB30]|nr:hypothetical protein ANMWB30_09510 [Arthrobacter sp. MWB30]
MNIPSALGGPWTTWIYAKLNSYGSIVVVMKFSSTNFRGLIDAILDAQGWTIEDTGCWDTDRIITVVRSGPRLISASNDAATKDLLTALSCVPNRLEFLEAKFIEPDFAQVPAWSIDRRAKHVNAAGSKTPQVYGDRKHVFQRLAFLFPQMTPVPINAAARLQDPRPPIFKSWKARWAAVFAILGLLILGWYLHDCLPDVTKDPTLLSFAFPLFMGTMSAWLITCQALYHLALLIAERRGKFTTSGFSRRLLKEPFLADSPEVLKALSSWTWPTRKSTEDPGLVLYSRLKILRTDCAFGGGSIILGGLLHLQWQLRPETPEGLLGALAVTCLLGALWFTTQLFKARWLLQSRTLPKVTLNIASAAIAVALLTRFPAWAYLSGMDAGYLVGIIDWTQLISFAPATLVLVLLGLLAWLLVWISRQLGPGRFLMASILGLTALVGLLNIAQSEMIAGYKLRVQGTADFAKLTYPVRACVATLADPEHPHAAWILGSTSSQTFFVTRSPGSEPLQTPGHVSAVPNSTITVTLDPVEVPTAAKPEGAACG